MKQITTTILTCLALLTIAWTQRPQPRAAITIPGRMARVIDGDTVDVDLTMRIRVRMMDCWAPEARTDEGLASTTNLRALAKPGDQVVVEVPLKSLNLSDHLTLNRVLGYVWRNGQNLSDVQVRMGHATAKRKR